MQVKDFWYRFEWQARGTGHVHGVLWTEDCPEINDDYPTDQEVEELKQYFDSKCYAWNINTQTGPYHPCDKLFIDIPDDEKEMDLMYLLNTVQRHTMCGNHCLRKDTKTGKQFCRFKFPKDLRDESAVEDCDGYLSYIPVRNDGHLQRYHPMMTHIWRANTDFSPIASMESVLRFIFALLFNFLFIHLFTGIILLLTFQIYC